MTTLMFMPRNHPKEKTCVECNKINFESNMKYIKHTMTKGEWMCENCYEDKGTIKCKICFKEFAPNSHKAPQDSDDECFYCEQDNEYLRKEQEERKGRRGKKSGCCKIF